MRLYTRNELKITAIATGAVSLLAVLITILVLLPGRDRLPREQTSGESEAVFLPDISDLAIPDEFTLTGSDTWAYARERPKRWTQEQVDRFWIDPAEISLDILEKETDALVRELMEKIP